MTFRDLFANAKAAGDVLVTETGRYGAADLMTEQVASGNTFPASIAISFSDNADLIKALVACDGKVARVLLLSSSVGRDVCASLLAKAETDLIFTDRGDFEQSRTLADLCQMSATSSTLVDTAWLMATSGTTNEPKLVSHSFASLTRTVRYGKASTDFIWGQVYDTCRFAGMQVLLQALAGGSMLVAPTVHLPLDQRLALFSREHVNALSATPTLWRKILMAKNAENLALKSLTLGGEISDQSILSALATRFPAARVRHIYASTEAGTGFSVTDGLAGFPDSYLTEGFNGIGIKIIDDILYIENPLVSGTYLGADENYAMADHYVNTGDRVVVREGRVYFLGRASGVINVGGDKVFPETVEVILNGVDGVLLSRVYGKKSPITGALVVAEIVLAEGADKPATEERLLLSSKAQLAPHQRPIAFKFVDSIAVSENGKVVRV